MFVSSATLNTLQVDGAYVYAQPPTPVPGQGVNTSLGSIVGTGAWGLPNVPQPANSQNFGSFVNCGEDPYSLITEAYFANALSNNNLGVRVSDQTDVAASGSLLDSGGTNGVGLLAVNTGTDGNTISVSLALGSNTTVSAPTLTATIQRFGYAPEVYSNLANPSSGGFAAALIAAVNNGITGVRGASQLVTAYVVGVASTAGFAVTTQPVALSGATNGALFLAAPAAPGAGPTVAVVGTTGTTQYQYEVVFSGNGDSVPSAIGNVTTGNVALSASNYNTVSWSAPPAGVTKVKILRQIGGAGGYMLLATVSASVTSLQDKGQYTASAYIALTNVTASQAQVGADGITGRTGMYALRGTGVQQFILAGNTDSSQWAVQATFAQSIGAMAIVAFPSGTSTASAISAKQTANAVSPYLAVVKDWINFTDPNTGALRLVSPLGEALGLISSLPPEQSPGNKPVAGLSNFVSTERTGSPYSYQEAQQLQGAGILYFTNPIPRGSVFGLAHGENASASVVGVNAVTDNICYTRMMNYEGASIAALLGQYVDALQGTQPNDPTRANAKATLSQWQQSLKDQGRIDDFKITLDLTNNTPLTIAQGYGLALVQTAFMNVTKFWLATLQGGSAIQLSFGTAPNNAFLTNA